MGESSKDLAGEIAAVRIRDVKLADEFASLPVRLQRRPVCLCPDAVAMW